MADILEFEGLNEKPKKKKLPKKKQILLYASIIVGLVALVMWYKKKEAGITSYVASGYDGYPSLNSSGGTATDDYVTELEDYYEGIISENEEIYTSEKDSLNEYYQNLIVEKDSEWGTAYNELEEDYSTLEQEKAYSDIVNQMKTNSDLWYLSSSESEKAQLAAENLSLGESIGATRDKITGVWVDASGSRLYETPLQAAGQSIGNRTISDNTDYQAVINRQLASGLKGDSAEVVNNVINRATKIVNSSDSAVKQYATSYDKNVDYQAAINTAKANGASQAVIDQLTAQRNAKIIGENLNQDGTRK